MTAGAVYVANMTATIRKLHKCTIQYGASVSCACGWRSATWFGKGARANAYAEWRSHLEKCLIGGS